MKTRSHRPIALIPPSAACAALLLISVAGTASEKLQKQLSIPADQLRELDIVADEGELRVTGSDTAEEITVSALITVKGDIGEREFTEFLDTWMDLDLYRHGRSAELIAKISAGSLVKYQPRIDLVIVMPASLDLVVKDAGGTLEVYGIEGDVRISDGSGKIILREVSGDIEIDDGAGSLEIAHSVGDIEVHDLTGWVRLTAVDGSVFLNKQSGRVRIDGLSGDLVLEGDAKLDIESVNHLGEIKSQH